MADVAGVGRIPVLDQDHVLDHVPLGTAESTGAEVDLVPTNDGDTAAVARTADLLATDVAVNRDRKKKKDCTET